MREVIITDLTRFSSDEKVCTAVIDVKSGECLRPMPYLKSDRCRELGVHPGAILQGDLKYINNPSSPHIEDANYSKLKFVGVSTSDQFKGILDNSLSQCVSSGFGINFVANQKHIPSDQVANCSIITIKVKPHELSIHEDQYKPGKIKASFVDSIGESFRYLSITDRGFHDFAKQHQSDGKLFEVVNHIEQQDEIYLRIGLSRAYQSPDGRNGYWLQVNGIYTFPSYHQDIRSYE